MNILVPFSDIIIGYQKECLTLKQWIWSNNNIITSNNQSIRIRKHHDVTLDMGILLSDIKSGWGSRENH